LPDAFDNASSPDFQVRPNSDGTSSVTTVNTTYMHCSDKYKFDISPGNFTVTIGAGNMVTEITRAHYNVSPGIDLYLDYKIKTKCTVVTRSDGTQALMLQDDGNIETSHTIEKSAGVTITEIVLGAIAGAIFAGIGEMGGQLVTKALVNANKIAAKSITAQVVKVIVSVFIGILAFGIIVNISNFIIATADQDANKLPPFDPFVKAAVQNVNWPDATAAQVTSVRFNNGMQIGLDPKFAE
jgi:hypothetical protein